MSKTVSIEEPFQLSSYTSSYRGKQKSTGSEHVFVNSVSSRSKEGLVTVTAQADGVHLVDTSSLHSVISHTLGPSTSFSCPAATLGVEGEYTTYAVVEASPDLVDQEEGGRIVWRWRDSLSPVSSEKQRDTRVIVPASERIHGLYTTSNPSRILAATQAGRILVLDSSSLEEKGSLSLAMDIHRVFLFQSSECSFACKPSLTTLVTASFDGSGFLNVHVVSLDSNDQLSQSAQFTLSHKGKAISDISCSSSGCFTVLCKDGSWGSYALSTAQLRPLARPFKLAILSPETISITALTSSHVLLAALPPDASPSVAHIQIWDLQYSVLLSSHSLPLPSVFSSSLPGLKLIPARGQAILSLSTPNSVSSLFVIPYSIPPQSTLAVAISKGASTKPWIQSGAPEQRESESKSKGEVERERVVASIKSAMASGKVSVAEGAFGAWLKETEEPSLDYNFVKELLEVVLSSVGKNTPPHAPQIVKTLLDRGRSEWASIGASFSSVVDLPESDIIHTLITLVKLHRQQAAPGDAMQVDGASATDLPSLSSFLSLCVTYPNATSKGIVLGLKKWVRDPEDAASIAQVLESWMRSLGQQRKANGEVGLLPSNKDLEKNEHGVWVIAADKKVKKGKDAKKALPPLPKVVSFLQSFMDACFLQLLQHSPSHKLLQQLQAHLLEEASFSDVLEQLRGSLEPFAVGHQKTLKEAAIPEKEKERQRQKGDWRQRRNGAPAVVGAVGTIGVYQVEELVL
ncbi:hypothetical protein FA13DRAFT_1791065 [Coprinellus micaceus]|uniref:Uncharacterized protein n=1 Tax=Coprinellus micaceus TaxID=71717 RepID=A0A4Y7TDK7_COPMI|nr:hypothetical protein FA13DRAFT_1791065 [Coprinellus micaceus]